MSLETPRRNHGLLLVWGAALLAAALKVGWIFTSSGTCDTVLFFLFGKALDHSTLAEMYRTSPMFNHTPLTGCAVRALYRLVGGDYFAFAAGIRLASVAADLGILGGLLYLRRLTGKPAWWALVLFAASPVSLMISGFHGNVDPVMVLFLFAAVLALVAQRPILCGVLFAAACSVKVMPLVFGPVFAVWWLTHRRSDAIRFTATAAVVFLLGSAWPLLQCPGAYAHKVLGYGSYWGTWGVTYWLHQTGLSAFQVVDFKGLSSAQNSISSCLKFATVGAVLLLGWRRRKVAGPEFATTMTAAFAAIFVFAPGAGPQYLVWFAPFLAWSAPRWYAAITGCSAAYMAAFYHPSAKWQFPWDMAFPQGWEISVWGPWMNLPWGAFLIFAACEGRRWWKAEATAPSNELPPAPASEAGAAMDGIPAAV